MRENAVSNSSELLVTKTKNWSAQRKIWMGLYIEFAGLSLPWKRILSNVLCTVLPISVAPQQSKTHKWQTKSEIQKNCANITTKYVEYEHDIFYNFITTLLQHPKIFSSKSYRCWAALARATGKMLKIRILETLVDDKKQQNTISGHCASSQTSVQ